MKKALQSLLVTGLILSVLAGCSPLASNEKETPVTTTTPAEITPAAVLSAVPLSFKEYESSGSARSAGAARDVMTTPVPLGNDVPVVLDTRAIPDIDGNNGTTVFAKIFLTVLKNDIAKLPGFEFGKDKAIGHLEELSSETEAFLLENDMGSGDELLQVMDWGTIKVTKTGNEILVYWSFTMYEFSTVMCIHGTYVGDSFAELEIVSELPLPSLFTYCEKYCIENGKKTELVAYIADSEEGPVISFSRIERIDDTYVSYFVRKNGDSYTPVEIGLMDSTGGCYYYIDEDHDITYYFIDKDFAVMEKITYSYSSNEYEEYFATRYLELLSGHTLEVEEDDSLLPDMFLDDERINYGQSSSDGENYYTTIHFGRKDALLDAALTDTGAAGKLRFTKHDLVHSLKVKGDAFSAAAGNPALYTGLDVDHILELKGATVAWGAAL